MNESKKKRIYLITIIILFLSVITLLVLNLLPLFKSSNYDVFEDCHTKVVEVKATTEDYGTSYGTGTIIDEDLTILTNFHVVSYTKGNEDYIFDKIEIRFTYKEYFEECHLIKNDQDKVLLKLDNIEEEKNKKNFFKVEKREYKPGDVIYTIGNASNNGIAITKGIITMPAFNITYDNVTRKVIQIDASISNGNSGGPLINENGQLLGIITFKLKDTNNQIIDSFAYAIYIDEIIDFINE